jgi:hypothetical protein
MNKLFLGSLILFCIVLTSSNCAIKPIEIADREKSKLSRSIKTSGPLGKRLQRGEHLPILVITVDQMDSFPAEFTKIMTDSLRRYELTTSIEYNTATSLELAPKAIKRTLAQYAQEDVLIIETVDREALSEDIGRITLHSPIFDIQYYDHGNLVWRARARTNPYLNPPPLFEDFFPHNLLARDLTIAMRQDRLLPKHDLEAN